MPSNFVRVACASADAARHGDGVAVRVAIAGYTDRLGGLYDCRERPTCWKQESDRHLRKVRTVIAGGVNHSARVDPRLTGREHLGPVSRRSHPTVRNC
jgi:hypothetical protein